MIELRYHLWKDIIFWQLPCNEINGKHITDCHRTVSVTNLRNNMLCNAIEIRQVSVNRQPFHFKVSGKLLYWNTFRLLETLRLNRLHYYSSFIQIYPHHIDILWINVYGLLLNSILYCCLIKFYVIFRAINVVSASKLLLILTASDLESNADHVLPKRLR